ncbi:MAG: DUF3108 domain-containing protein [Bacteroidales bacterium]|nr:DUF3108 domain-containing protein [Bacteroidales bacterium]
MRYLYKIFIPVLLFLFAVPGYIRAQERELPFQAGEKAQIIIHYKYGPKMDIGKIDLVLSDKTVSGKPCFNVRADVSTYSFWDNFYKIRDVYESTFTADGMVPVSFLRDVKEGDFWAKNNYTWSNGGKRLHAIVDKKTRPHRDTVYNEKKVIRDVLNLFFACRALDIDKLLSGKVVHQIVAMDKDLLDIKLKYMGKENKKVSGLGTFRAVKIGVSVNSRVVEALSEEERTTFSIAPEKADGQDENVFYGDSKIFLWLSDDENHIPLFFTAPVKVGSINGRLGEHSGLKYPLSSKID